MFIYLLERGWLWFTANAFAYLVFTFVLRMLVVWFGECLFILVLPLWVSC